MQSDVAMNRVVEHFLHVVTIFSVEYLFGVLPSQALYNVVGQMVGQPLSANNSQNILPHMKEKLPSLINVMHTNTMSFYTKVYSSIIISQTCENFKLKI